MKLQPCRFSSRKQAKVWSNELTASQWPNCKKFLFNVASDENLEIEIGEGNHLQKSKVWENQKATNRTGLLIHGSDVPGHGSIFGIHFFEHLIGHRMEKTKGNRRPKLNHFSSSFVRSSIIKRVRFYWFLGSERGTETVQSKQQYDKNRIGRTKQQLDGVRFQNTLRSKRALLQGNKLPYKRWNVVIKPQRRFNDGFKHRVGVIKKKKIISRPEWPLFKWFSQDGRSICITVSHKSGLIENSLKRSQI